MKKIFLAVSFLLMACNSSESFKTGTYKMVNSPNETPIIISFNDDGTINAKVVNIIMGSYKVENNNLIIMPGGSTMMMGPVKDMETEQNFFKFMNTVNNYEINENNLTLTGKDGSFMKFEKIQEIPSNLK